MNINLLLIPTLVTALLLFVVGQRSVRLCRSRKRQIGVSVMWFFFGLPGFLLPLYYLHWFDDAKWFYEFRSLAGVRVGGVGHFIVIIKKSDGKYVTGDPLIGRQEVPADRIKTQFDFTGFFMEIQRGG